MRIGATLIALGLCAVGIMGCGTSAPRFRSEPHNTAPPRETGIQQLSGIASYYADEFDGRTTANGERYDMHALTAAHRTLPFNTTVRVTNNDNGRSVVVRINDRGPFKDDRVIDLSLEAAQRIGLIANGTAPVKLEILDPSAIPDE
jgi:rare lipoprotein A